MALPSCEICSQNSWDVLAKRVFRKTDADHLDEYNKFMFQFLFETWFENTTEIEFQNIYCRNCGFVSFFPRPTVDDLDHLRRRNTDVTVGYSSETDLAIAKLRSGHLYRYLSSHINLKHVKSVLDYGGNDGNLMDSFLAAGKDCFLIDYSPFAIPGVKKCGETVYDLNESHRFDLIVCNHVIEHIAAPRETLSLLVNHLTPNGILFVEVPMELWKRPPLLTASNPLTHVNFFSPNNLKNLLIAADASVFQCHLAEYFHTSGSWNPGIRCLARKKENPAEHPYARPDARDFLNPGPIAYLRYYLRNPRRCRTELLNRIRP